MKKYKLTITQPEYDACCANGLKMWLHTYKGDQLTIETAKPHDLCALLERSIDFGATSAYDVLDVPRRY